MLRLARLRGAGLLRAGSFNPRNDGPLIHGELSATGRGRTRAGSATTSAVGEAATGTGGGAAVLGTGAGSSDAPHMPQKRFPSEFSLPHRGQRTNLSSTYSLRYLTGSMQGGCDSVWDISASSTVLCIFCDKPFQTLRPQRYTAEVAWESWALLAMRTAAFYEQNLTLNVCGHRLEVL